ncbi:hypothetical protein BZG36_04092 [Bifiguratus adelaidae]|uniref:Phosphomannose isomerase type I C-terminal domain-containing protein n=1 Tax=Bifiguratus adelaidae TaxID=1938954 RepID=A0A261XX07_9FUNG|nr:hypothetical protein BZG36_04092 [Bifiguratus adelaidae]
MSGTAYPNTQHSILYDPPIDEFSVILTRLKAGEEERFAGIHGPSIFIVTEGEGQVVGGVGKREGGGQLVPGGVWFVGAGEGLTLTAGKSGLVVYRAFAVPV